MDLRNVSPEELKDPYNQLGEIIGVENLYKLTQSLSGNLIYIPKSYCVFKNHINKCIKKDFANGERINTLTVKYNLSRKTIHGIIKKYNQL